MMMTMMAGSMLFAAATWVSWPVSTVMPLATGIEEVEVTAEVVNGDGRIIVRRNGQERELAFDVEGLEEIDFEDLVVEMGGGEDSMSDVLGRLMGGDIKPQIFAEVIVETEDEDGHRVRRRMDMGGEDHERWMMIDGEGRDHAWIMDWSHHPGMPMPGHGAGPMGGWEHCGHEGMSEDMMRQHMHFLQEMHEHPEHVWEMIERLPPDMRREHEEILHHMGGADRHHGEIDGFVREGQQFATKLAMAREVASWLNNGEAMAIFGVWQARERMEPANRVKLLGPMVQDERLMTSVRNAAAWVVMEAQAELGESASGASTLREIILRNGQRHGG